MAKIILRFFAILNMLLVGLLMYQITLGGEKRPNNKQGRIEKPSNYEVEDAVEFFDDFHEGVLSKSRWVAIRENDFNQSIIDVFQVKKNDFRLRLMANTIGTRDNTVKFHAVRALKRVEFAGGIEISFDLDWNNQTNGSYLTAGLYLCPIITNTNPRKEPDWISLEYIGVPPGENARFQVVKKTKGILRFLLNEDWPHKQRAGRKISNQHLKLILSKNKFVVIENNKELIYLKDHRLDFISAYLYFHMTSHSNFPKREVYLDNISVTAINN